MPRRKDVREAWSIYASLPPDIQEVIHDDLNTAFVNRVRAMERALAVPRTKY